MATSLNPDELRFPEYDLGMPAEVVYDGQHDLPSLSPLADVPFLASSAQNPNIDPHLADNIINTYHHQLNSTMSGFGGFNDYAFPQHSDEQHVFEEQQLSPYEQQPAPQGQYKRQRVSTPQEQQQQQYDAQQYDAQQYDAQQCGPQQYGEPAPPANNPISYSAGYPQNPLGPTLFANEPSTFTTPNYNQPAHHQGSLSINVNAPRVQTQTPVGFRAQGTVGATRGSQPANSRPGHPNPKLELLPLDAPLHARPSSHEHSVSPTTPDEPAQSSPPSEVPGPTRQNWQVPARAKPGRKAIPRTEEEAKLTRRAQNATAQAKSRDRRQVREEELKKEVQVKVNELRKKDGELYTLQVSNDRLQAEVQRLQADNQMLQQQLAAQGPRNDSGFQGY